MSALAFDSHAFVKRLTEAGMPERQAAVLATEQTRLIEADLATKADIKALEATTKKEIELIRRDIESIRHDIKALEAATKADIELIRRDIKALEGATKKEIELIRLEMKALEHRVTATILKWMFGALAAQTVLIIGVVQWIVTSALPPVQ